MTDESFAMQTPRWWLTVCLTVLALPLLSSPAGAEPDGDARQRAIDAIKKLGGSVHDDPRNQGVNVYLSRTPVTDEDLRLLQAMPNLRRLHLDDTTITDAGLKHVKALSALTEVSLFRTNVTEGGLQELRKARPGIIVLHSPKPPAFQPKRLLGLLILFPFFAIGVFLLVTGVYWRNRQVYLRVRAAILGAALILVCMFLAVIAVLQSLGFNITVKRLLE